MKEIVTIEDLYNALKELSGGAERNLTNKDSEFSYDILFIYAIDIIHGVIYEKNKTRMVCWFDIWNIKGEVRVDLFVTATPDVVLMNPLRITSPLIKTFNGDAKISEMDSFANIQFSQDMIKLIQKKLTEAKKFKRK